MNNLVYCQIITLPHHRQRQFHFLISQKIRLQVRMILNRLTQHFLLKNRKNQIKNQQQTFTVARYS